MTFEGFSLQARQVKAQRGGPASFHTSSLNAGAEWTWCSCAFSKYEFQRSQTIDVCFLKRNVPWLLSPIIFPLGLLTTHKVR